MIEKRIQQQKHNFPSENERKTFSVENVQEQKKNMNHDDSAVKVIEACRKNKFSPFNKMSEKFNEDGKT